MSNNQERGRSDLFLLRLWTDERDDNLPGQSAETEPDEASRRHGRLLNVLSGEGHNFDGWRGLIALLEEIVPPPDQSTLSEMADIPPARGR